MMILRDQQARDAIITERTRNVVVDAGAGTGKTGTILRRFVQLLAPADGAAGIPIERLAAITFTRRAAGELKYRIRGEILRTLSSDAVSPARREALHCALSGLDAAFIGTIHSFADRLLRLRPREAELSPAYTIEEGTGGLVSLACERLLLAAERSDIAAVTGLPPAAAREAEATIQDYLGAGYPPRGSGEGFQRTRGLDDLLSGLVGTRDVKVALCIPGLPDVRAIATVASAAAADLRPLTSETPGKRALGCLLPLYESLSAAIDPRSALIAFNRLVEAFPRDLKMGDHFAKERDSWNLYNRLLKGLKEPPLADLRDWMSARLAGLSQAAVRVYEAVKREREVVDQTDLLLKLRDVLHKPEPQRFYAKLFAHIFVDEFQDTDPVQADILQQLIRREDGTAPRAGSITIVGDPKQSIYRFRRADIAAYAQFRAWLADSGSLVCSLVSNFRSVRPLVEFVNRRFTEIMGAVKDQTVFDPATGKVLYESIEPTVEATGPAVHLVPFAGDPNEKLNAEGARQCEAQALARYLVHLTCSQIEVGRADKQRPATWGDIAVLSPVTTGWPLLFHEFDRFGIPWSARGGSVFARDPLVRSFILGLNAIADPEDGVAQAAFFRPPFWPVSLDDIAGGTGSCSAARALHKMLHHDRLLQPPARTARLLLEDSRGAAMIEGGPNGPRSLARIRELIHQVDALSRAGQDFDAIARKLRTWLDDPSDYDAPEPVGENAVRFLTIHQAKGLEFPVIVLSNALHSRKNAKSPAWLIAADGMSAAVSVKGLSASIPPGTNLEEREGEFEEAERLRLAYVAATRARDLLVLSCHDGAESKDALSPLLAETPGLTLRVAPWRVDAPPDWAAAVLPRPFFTASAATADDWKPAWSSGLEISARPITTPTAITKAVRPAIEADIPAAEVVRAVKGEGRFGREFGIVVHRALQLILFGASGMPAEIVRRCAAAQGLTRHVDEAIADVGRALEALAAIPGVRMAEYPVAAYREDGRLLEGYVDVLCVSEHEVWVVDFKTDAPPKGEVEKELPHYVEQVRMYTGVLRESNVFEGRRIRAALLLTAEGRNVEVMM